MRKASICRMLALCLALFTSPGGWAVAGQAGELAGVGPWQPVSMPPAAKVMLPLGPVAAPDALLNAATLAVNAYLKTDPFLQTSKAQRTAELIEATILPLFDLRHMTRNAVARNWRMASPEQQKRLLVEFQTLLTQTYVATLANYRDQVIEYRLLPVAKGEAWVTVKSAAKRPGANPGIVDYVMTKTATGWKVHDIKIADISLIATYRASFAATVREQGVDGLIQSLAATNRQVNTAAGFDASNARSAVFSYSLMTSILRGRQ